jgi:Tfp pilus assembly protein PilO
VSTLVKEGTDKEEEVKPLFRERQQILICVAAVAIVGGFVLFRYLPLHRRLQAIEQRQTAQKLALAKAETEKQQLPVLTEQLRETQEKIGDYDAKIPRERNHLGVFLQQVTNLMNEHDLRENVIQPGQEIKADGLKCIPVDMRCKGRMDRIFEFYKRMQGLNRLVRIEHIKLENDTSFSGEVSMQTKAVVYYRMEPDQG